MNVEKKKGASFGLCSNVTAECEMCAKHVAKARHILGSLLQRRMKATLQRKKTSME